MYEVSILTGFSSAHRLENYRGKCENLHGHNWKVEITVESDSLDETGLAMDFKDLKARAGVIIEELDHTNLSELPHFRKQNPTTENIARFIYEKMEGQLKGCNARISSVSVSESDSSRASYRRDACEK